MLARCACRGANSNVLEYSATVDVGAAQAQVIVLARGAIDPLKGSVDRAPLAGSLTVPLLVTEAKNACEGVTVTA
jgi:hypothetical protein